MAMTLNERRGRTWMKHAISLGAALFLLISMPSCGQERPQGQRREAIRAACEAEIKKFCVGDQRIGQCLRKNQTELSDACKVALGERDG
jgi:hypothetical protein